MELKLELKLGKEVARDSSNRTFMELKLLTNGLINRRESSF